MAEYIELNELQKFCRKYTEKDAVGLILADRTDLLHPVDVVERSEYNELARVNKALQERVAFLESNRPCRDCGSNPISKYAELENENKYFKEKIARIDTAIEEMNALPKDCEYELGVSACLEILKRNLEGI